MAKQTFTTGQVLTAAQMTSLQQTAMLGGAASTKTTSYVLVAADAGTSVAMNSTSATTVTVNTGLFAAGDTVTIINQNTGVCTVTAGTATVRKASGASLALSQYQGGVLDFISASEAIFFPFDVGSGSPLTTKGDLFTFDTANARLPVGTNGQALLADSTAATGLKWGAVATTKNFSLLGTGNCSGAGAATVTVTGISGMDQLYIMFNGVSSASASSSITLRFNGDTSTNYDSYNFYLTANVSYAANNMDATSNLSNDRFPIAVTGINAASGVWGHAIISGCNTDGKKMISSFASGDTNTSGNRGYWAGGVWNNTATVTSVSVVSTTGNLDLGTFLVFGAA